MPILTSLIFVGYAALTFNATSPEQAQIEVEPGYWNWSHQTTLANIPFSEENTECLPPCLLYTSPSPRDEKVSRMPSSA